MATAAAVLLAIALTILIAPYPPGGRWSSSLLNLPHESGPGEKDGARTLGDIMVEVEPLARHGANQHAGGGGPDAIRSSKAAYGTSAAYLAARIKRDAPDIAARVEEYPSIRAAAEAAGILSKTRRV